MAAVQAIAQFFWGILLTLDSIVYFLISWLYQIILLLCRIDILGNGTEISELVGRVYTIIGVVILFLVAYSLLRAMVNPDDLKGKKSPTNIVKNVLISIALIALTPTIFSFALDFQNALLEQNTIGKLVLGDRTDGESSATTIEKGGNRMAATVLQSFLHPNYSQCTIVTSDDGSVGYDCPEIATGGLNFLLFEVANEHTTYDAVWDEVENNGNFLNITTFAYALAHESTMTYYPIISTIAGAFVFLVLLSYCIDIAIRTIKLAVFELIAPLPILARIMPGEQGNKVFSNWVKACISTYTEVFIRLAILFFAVLIIKIVIQNIPTIFLDLGLLNGDVGITVFLFTQAFLVIGIILFVKQAPQILKDITGLDSGKYNVLRSAKQALSFVGGGIMGRSPAAAVRAWEQTGKDGNLRSIGDQYKRRLAKTRAKAEGATFGSRTGDRFRKAFGMPSLKESYDTMMEQNRNMNGQYLKAVNDTASDVLLRDDKGEVVKDANGKPIKLVNVGDTWEFNEENTRKLQEAKNRNAIAISEIGEEVKQAQDILEVDKKVNGKGKADEISGKEMAKTKYYLRRDGNELENISILTKDSNGYKQLTFRSQNELKKWLDESRDNRTISDKFYNSISDQYIAKDDFLKITTKIDGKMVTVGGKDNPLNQKQFEEWFAANREKMSSEEVTRIGHILNQSVNVVTKKHFFDHNGEYNGKENAAMTLYKEELADNLRNYGIVDANGKVEHNKIVYEKDGKTKTIDIQKMISNPHEMKYDDLKNIKEYVEEVVGGEVNSKLRNLNKAKSDIDYENAAIDRMQAQVKEQIEVAKSGDRYTAAKAASDANRMEDGGKKG